MEPGGLRGWTVRRLLFTREYGSGCMKLPVPLFDSSLCSVSASTQSVTNAQTNSRGNIRQRRDWRMVRCALRRLRGRVSRLNRGSNFAYSSVDLGEAFTYTGSGGRDLKGTKQNPKNLRTAPQTSDQSFQNSYNAALKVSTMFDLIYLACSRSSVLCEPVRRKLSCALSKCPSR